MLLRDGAWWAKHKAGIPKVLIGDRDELKFGAHSLVLIHPGPAHTQGDLYVVIAHGEQTIVATGDIVFNTYYPMMDLGEGGMDLDGLIAANHSLAEQYPNAIFIPGHGPVATAPDLLRYAAYLEAIRDQVAAARKTGASEDRAANSINLSSFNLAPLPTFHNNHLCWSGAEIDARWVYQLEAGTRLPREECTF
jgi:glyoxylase-like metal-dependent hydrolase (beta-lactamase superfamily II)